MEYLLDRNENFTENFVYWVRKFAINKILTTSQRTVKDKIVFNECINEIERAETIIELNYYFKKIRNCGYSGLNIYHQPIIKLFEFLIDQKISLMKEINQELIIRFLTQATIRMSNATKKNYRITITNLFNYIDQNNIGNKGASHKYKFDFRTWEKNSIVPKPNLPIFLEEEEIRKFLIVLDKYEKKSYSYYRNSYMLKTVLFTGIRSEEVINLRYKNISEKNGLYVLSIIGKGNKYREVLINKKYLESFLDQEKLFEKSDELIFLSQTKKDRVTQAYLSRVVDNVLTMAKIKKSKKGTHLLRHTFATQLYRKTKDVHLLKEALGHGDINTSMIYTHIDDNTLEKTTTIMDDLV